MFGLSGNSCEGEAQVEGDVEENAREANISEGGVRWFANGVENSQSAGQLNPVVYVCKKHQKVIFG